MDIQLTDIPAILVGLYSTEFALTTITILMITFLAWSRPIPALFDITKLGRISRIIGFIAKSLPRLVVTFHYIIMIIILVMIGQVAKGKCSYSVRPTDTSVDITLSKPETFE